MITDQINAAFEGDGVNFDEDVELLARQHDGRLGLELHRGGR